MPRNHPIHCACADCDIWRSAITTTHWVRGDSVYVHLSCNDPDRSDRYDGNAGLSQSCPGLGKATMGLDKLYVSLMFDCETIRADWPHISLAYSLCLPCVVGGRMCESKEDVQTHVSEFLNYALFPDYHYALYVLPYGSGWGYLVQQCSVCSFFRYVVSRVQRFMLGPMYDDSAELRDLFEYHITPQYDLGN